MRPNHIMRRFGLTVLTLAPVLALISMTGSATAYPVQYCAGVPIFNGTPPWGFHTGQPIGGATGSYARGHGDISLTHNTVSGVLCQVDRVRHQPDRLIVMSVKHHLVYHSHHAVMWGVPGNIMKIDVRVKSSTDRRCKVGTLGHVTLFTSYNNVRSDSVQFFFPAACAGHDLCITARRSTTRSRLSSAAPIQRGSGGSLLSTPPKGAADACPGSG